MDGAAWSSPPPPELAMMARAVERLVARNDALLLLLLGPAATGGGGGEWATTTMSNDDNRMAAFEAARGAPPPRIGVAEYLERMHRYAALQPECYVVAYAYVDRAAHRRPAAAVASRNVHRLLLACLLVASKVLDDFHHNNAFFARVGGVSNREMNKLELELLGLLDFEVAVCHRAYRSYRDHLEKEMLRHNGSVKARPPPAAPVKTPAVVVPWTATVVVDPPPKPNGAPVMPPTIREILAVDY